MGVCYERDHHAIVVLCVQRINNSLLSVLILEILKPKNRNLGVFIDEFKIFPKNSWTEMRCDKEMLRQKLISFYAVIMRNIASYV